MVDQKKTVLITGGEGTLAQSLVTAFQAAHWHTLHPGHLVLDVQQPDSIYAYFAQLSHLDALVCNAGEIADRRLDHLSETAWDDILSVNLRGAFLCAQAAHPLFSQPQGGSILFIGSYVGSHGAVGQSNYAAAKAGLIGLSASLAREWAPQNIRCHVVLPGYLPSQMNAHLPEKIVHEIRTQHVLNRFNTADQAARFIVHLTTMEHVSGQVFQLDSRISRAL